MYSIFIMIIAVNAIIYFFSYNFSVRIYNHSDWQKFFIIKDKVILVNLVGNFMNESQYKVF
jgi:hypothetical protein